jgi:DNA repair protein RadC
MPVLSEVVFRVAESGPRGSFMDSESPLGRLQARGAGTLTTTELLSLLISSGNGSRSKKDDPTTPLDKAAKVFNRIGSLRALASFSPGELVKSCGLGIATAARLSVITELARRFSEEDVAVAETLSGAEETYKFLKPRLRDLPHEVFAVIFLNQKHGVLAYRELFRGSIHASSVHPREVVKAVLKENAAAVILAHNHPSGHVSPSPDDLRLTEDLKTLLAHLDVRVIDHLIVGGNGYFSFAREGLLNR